jgi:hypothetical protein
MKKVLFNAVSSVLAIISISINATCVCTYASDVSNYDENYVIEKYIGDPELEAYVSEKQALAERYYDALCSGNTEAIYEAQDAYEKLETSNNSNFTLYSNENNRYGNPPSSCTISLTHYTQENGHYCGPTTALMILKKIGVTNITQYSLANSLGTNNNGTAWYFTNGDSFSQFPMMTTLNNYQGYKYYIPSPMGAAGSNPLSEIQVKSYVVSATSYYYPIALCGISTASGNGHLPNYPSSSIDHWITCIGYNNYGDSIYVDDPASGYSSDFFNVPNKYYITSSNCSEFISPRGMIW